MSEDQAGQGAIAVQLRGLAQQVSELNATMKAVARQLQQVQVQLALKRT